jgi:O-antigen ligase
VTLQLQILNSKVTKLALGVAVFAMPFSIKVCHISVLVYLFCWALNRRWSEKLRIIRESVILQITCAIFVLAAIGVLYSENTADGWFAIDKKIFFLLLPVAIGTSESTFTSSAIKRYFFIFVTACFIGSLICIVNAIQSVNSGVIADYLSGTDFTGKNPEVSKAWLLFSYVSLSHGIGIHPTFFSLYLSFCLLFIFSRLQGPIMSPLKKGLLWALCLYFLLFIICLSTRIIILGLVVISLAYIYRELRYSRSKANAMITGVFLATMIAMIYANPISRYRNFQEARDTSLFIESNSEYKNSVQIRLSLWWMAIKSVTYKNFLAGAGTGDVKTEIKKTSSAYGVTNVLNSYDPHNQFLYTLLAHGMIGLLLLLASISVQAWCGWQNRRYLFLSTLFLFGAVCLTESALELQKGIIFFSLMMPLMLAEFSAYRSCSWSSPRVAVHAKQ